MITHHMLSKEQEHGGNNSKRGRTVRNGAVSDNWRFRWRSADCGEGRSMGHCRRASGRGGRRMNLWYTNVESRLGGIRILFWESELL